MKSLNVLLSEIRLKQERVSQETSDPIEEAYQMTLYLTGILQEVRERILKNGFAAADQEVQFFRYIKPQILGQLMYYNKVFRIEAACPVHEGKLYHKFFMGQLQELKQEFKDYVCGSDFYRYYRSGRNDRDAEYFLRGRINFSDGLSNFVFEVDPQFSTYYDSRVARIIANDLIYVYLTRKINPDESSELLQQSDAAKEICWTDSKNALIELIYALHASGVISHGKIGIRKVSLVFQLLFRIPLGDIHHSFHRMKDRSGTRTSFIDHLKLSLESYMDRGL
ncbi:RteC domain-containing protein [Flavobacterium qiangtangense]|uniref:RteC domain-containing protein n=1 Tax=Flavobacterium qiangtangense TaxID=1442595 RepID=A0ABW1PIU9_9FLAO